MARSKSMGLAKAAFWPNAPLLWAEFKARAAMSHGGGVVPLHLPRLPYVGEHGSCDLDRYVDSGVLEWGHKARLAVQRSCFHDACCVEEKEPFSKNRAPRLRIYGVSRIAPRAMRRFSMTSQLDIRGFESSGEEEGQASTAKRVRKVLDLNDPETYARLQRMVRKVCPAWLERERDDFAQKAMIRLLERAKRLGSEDEQGLCASYLYRTAHSTVIDEIRKRKREVLAEDIEDYRGADAGHAKHEELRSNESPLGNASSKALRAAIQDCLSRLAPERSRAVSLRLEGFKISEIAQMLDWNKKRAENMERRGRENLRDCLKGKGYEIQC